MGAAKVLVVGSHIGRLEQTEACLLRAFRAEGCLVEAFDFQASALVPASLSRVVPSWLRSLLSPRRVPALDRADKRRSNRNLMGLLERLRPDLVIALRAERLTAESVRAIRGLGGVSMNWPGDEPWRYVPEDVVACYDLWAVIDPAWGVWLQDHGAGRVEHLPLACDPELHLGAELTPHERARWHSGLCFVGSHTEGREETLRAVADLGLSIWGPLWENACHPEIRGCVRGGRLARTEWLRAYAAADIVLNAQAQCSEGLNLRVWEALAAGACLVADYHRDIDRFLQGAVATYEGPQELRQRCLELMRDPQRRRALAEKGRSIVLASHTFRHRARLLLKWARECRGAK